MCAPGIPCEELANGRWGRVLGVRDRPDRCPASKYIKDLDPSERGAVQSVLDWIAVNGPKHPKVKHERGEIWAIRPTGIVRFACARRETALLVTHGFKKSGKWPPQEFKRAERLLTIHERGVKR